MSTEVQHLTLENMISRSDSIFLVEELTEKVPPLARTYKHKNYSLTVKKFRVIEVLTKEKTHPEIISAYSENERKYAELEIQARVTGLSVSPIDMMPEMNIRAGEKDKKKILFVKFDPVAKIYVHPWNWVFISESYSEKIKSLVKNLLP